MLVLGHGWRCSATLPDSHGITRNPKLHSPQYKEAHMHHWRMLIAGIVIATIVTGCGGSPPVATQPTPQTIVQTVMVAGTPQTLVVTATPEAPKPTAEPSLKDTIIIFISFLRRLRQKR